MLDMIRVGGCLHVGYPSRSHRT